MAKSTNNTPAKVEEKSTAVATYDYGSMAGVGFENQTNADIAMPFLAVLQSNSPQVQDVSDGGIEGAKPGMLFNTVTNELINGKEGVILTAAHTDHCFMEWVPRDNGGGLVGRHEIDSEVVKKAKAKAGGKLGKLQTETGNDLIETFYVYAVMDDGQFALLAFTSTKISVYKRFNSAMRMYMHPTPNGGKVNPPLMAYRWKLTTVKEKNNKGEYFNFVLTPAEGTLADSLNAPNSPLFKGSVELRQMVLEGLAKVNYDAQNATSGKGGDASDAGTADKGSEEAPY